MLSFSLSQAKQKFSILLDQLATLAMHSCLIHFFFQTPVLGLGLGVDFTFAWDNNNKNNDNNDKNNPHLNFLKATVLGEEEQGLGIRVQCQGTRFNGKEIRPKWSLTLKTKSCMPFFWLIFTISSRALLNLKGKL